MTEHKELLPEWVMEIKKRHAKTTSGDWHTVDQCWLPKNADTYVIAGHHDPHVGTAVFSEGGTNDDIEWAEIAANCEFTAHAHQDIPRLLQSLEQALGKLERAKEALEFCASDQADHMEFTVYAPKRTKGQYRAMRALKELEE